MTMEVMQEPIQDILELYLVMMVLLLRVAHSQKVESMEPDYIVIVIQIMV